MQHTPFWGSKSRILRIKKARTKIGTLRISHTSSKLHQDIPPGASQRPTWGKWGILLTRFGDWVEHTSVAQVEVSPYPPPRSAPVAKLLSLNLYMILLSQFCVFAHSASTLYWCQLISEFQKHAFENFQLSWCFLIFLLPFYGDVNWSHRKMET